MNIREKIETIKNLETTNLHQKIVIDRLSRKIQKLHKEIKKLKESNTISEILPASYYRKRYSNNEILILNTNSINQKIKFHGRTYVIGELILKQEIGCIDELQIKAHDISINIAKKAGEINE